MTGFVALLFSSCFFGTPGPDLSPARLEPTTRGGSPMTIGDLRRSRRASAYEAPSALELEQSQELFRLLFRGAPIEQIEELGRALSLGIERLSVGGEPIVVLCEYPDRIRGWGLFVFRERNARPVVIEAPHSYHDRHTGILAERFFRESHAVAGAWNTTPRNASSTPSVGGADLCHRPDSMLQRFTRAFASRFPQGKVIQLHGFDPAKRKSRNGRRAAVILSNGTFRASGLSQITRCLEPHFENEVFLFPRDLTELGGTTNAQGRALRAARHAGFLHVELSLTAREALRSRAPLRRSVWRCLIP